MKRLSLLIFLILTFPILSQTLDIDSKIKTLEEKLTKQEEIIKKQQIIIEELKSELNKLKNNTASKTTEEKEEENELKLKPTGLFGSSNLLNPNISVVMNTFAYTSNLKNKDLESRNIKGFNSESGKMEKGFHLEAAELHIYAPVDPYFNFYTAIPVTEDGAKVEEAYFTTTSLPYGFQIKGGKFKSHIGRLNSIHCHAWDFFGSPLVYKSFLGHGGLTEKGLGVYYLPSLPFYLNLGGEILQGNNEVLFGDGAKNGPHAYSFFAKTSFDFGQYSTVLTGLSYLKGNTLTETVKEGSLFNGKSTLYNFEFTYKWKKSHLKGFILQSEYLKRKQDGKLFTKEIPNYLERDQDGFYIQGVYLFRRWRTGLRYDRLNLFKDTYKLDSDKIDFGKNPYRISWMVEYNPTEFSRIRLQYNHDKSDVTQKTNREWILQFIFGIGAHAAHSF